ncbi:tetratricopeptide repeat protein [Paraburkholderia silviterrae]|uniref:tetratricopeptide repeat protein n=1 Tax=Paraburkholderia silviterrae TaxID=2528715 RepID=UPI001F0F6CEB|nr:tetratricopeptide repeat protein [Paraburkholderia silviterrae]
MNPSLPTLARTTRVALLAPLAAALLATGCASNHFVTPQPAAATHLPDAQADMHVAESALEAGDTQLAVSLFEKQLKTDPQSKAAQLGLGDAMYQTGDLARAGVLYARVAVVAPDDARAMLGLARVALRQRRLDEAEKRYRVLLAAHPEQAVAAEGLGSTLDLEGKHAQAQAVYRAALQQHPEVAGLKADLGLSLILAGDVRAGANVLLDVAGLPDAPPQARENLALAYGLLGNDQAAKRILVTDMPADSAEDNLRFYEQLRERLATATRDTGDARSAGGAQTQPVSAASVAPVGVLR